VLAIRVETTMFSLLVSFKLGGIRCGMGEWEVWRMQQLASHNLIGWWRDLTNLNA